MKFVFLGDVHNNLNHCYNVCQANLDSTIVQVGDYGVGFVPLDVLRRMSSNFKFFVGNHDHRELAKTLPHCLGDYGEYEGKFFFVSGANSIDRDQRIEGVSWWPDEELSYAQAEDCLEKWDASKVDVLVAHDVPQSFAEGYMLIYDKALTRNLLQSMIEVRKPKLFIHGHHHKSNQLTFNGIKVVSLGIKECFSIDI